MDYEEHREAVQEHLNLVTAPDVNGSQLSNAMYSASELGVFGDFELDDDTAIEIWKAVESVRLNGFPKELYM